MSFLRTRPAGPAPESADPGARPPGHSAVGGLRIGDLIAVVALIIEAGAVEFYLRQLLTRPFYYDEASRAYEIAQGGQFLSHLSTAAAPLAAGWVAIETVARLVLGDTEAGLRAPMFLTLPLLAVATYVLARRWLAVGVSFAVAALLLANLWIVNYGLQLKSYSYEALFAVATLGLYLLMQRSTWNRAQTLGLSAAMGLTCAFSLPNLFVVGPLLVLDLVRAFRQRARLRICGGVLAGAIALAHFVLFVRPQSRVASTGFFQDAYAPHSLGAFLRFVAAGFESYFPSIITGVVGATNAPPSYHLPPVAHAFLAVALVILLAAGVAAAARDPAGRALIVAAGGPLLLELVGSVTRQWPFGLIRVNIFVVPLLYILAGMGAVWLARAVRGPRPADGITPASVAWPRAAGIAVLAAALVAAGTAAGLATAKGFAETSRLQAQPTMFGGVKAAVTAARAQAAPGDLVIIRSDRRPSLWYAAPWLYYMDMYQGDPAEVAGLPRIPARNTTSVFRVTPAAVDRFVAAHPRSPAIFLLEFNFPGYRFPKWAHQQSLDTLRQLGYCPVSDVWYPVTGHLTVLNAGCSKS